MPWLIFLQRVENKTNSNEKLLGYGVPINGDEEEVHKKSWMHFAEDTDVKYVLVFVIGLVIGRLGANISNPFRNEGYAQLQGYAICNEWYTFSS